MPWDTRGPLGVRIAGEGGVMTLDFERERADVAIQRGIAPGAGDVGERHRAFDAERADLDFARSRETVSMTAMVRHRC